MACPEPPLFPQRGFVLLVFVRRGGSFLGRMMGPIVLRDHHEGGITALEAVRLLDTVKKLDEFTRNIEIDWNDVARL